MTEIQKKNINIMILTSTDPKLEEIAAKTFRTKGAVIDWLVSEKWDELFSEIPSPSPATEDVK